MSERTQQPLPFAHVHAPKAALYRRIMRAFVDAKRRFLVHLRPEDIAQAIQDDSVEGALSALVEWGNLRADPDTSRVTSVEDFLRARYLYQLTAEGEAAELALDAYDQALGRRGELQSVALEDIRVRAHSLLEQARLPAPDAAVVHNLLRELASLLENLAANASAFMGSLQRTIELQDIDEEAFIAYKDRLIRYLERFIGDLQIKSADIAEALRQLDALETDRLLQIAAAREVADVAPDVAEEPGAGPDPAFDAKVAEWRGRWSGVRSWFVGERTRPSQASLLRQHARASIPALLETVMLLQERRSGRSDRSADFRRLAVWFAEAPDDAAAHRLWRAAFGLTSARHLTADSAYLDAIESRQVPASTSWRDGPAVPISARLRSTGRYQRPGPMLPVVDRSAAQRLLGEQLEAEHRQTEAARQRLATGRPTRLSDLRELDREEFGLFLNLLADALSAGPLTSDGVRTVTSDGTLEIQMVPTSDGAVAEIHTPDGIFGGQDHLITITDLLRSAQDATFAGMVAADP
jgi:uncharacterized protein (TIGR02677 family)